MNQTRLQVAAGIIALVIIAEFALSAPHTRETVQTPVSPTVATVPPVTLHDVFKKGIHTITGSIEAPNACAIVTAEANLQGDASTTETIQVAISLSTDTNVCLQLPTPMSFSTTIVAPAHLSLSATVNGSLATTTSS
ncbi:MAG TPA: hypothetical protein VNF51_01495 [Candidatus Paceibacterota bacterium]|nr:hypothetical protein [Candidatus Paceibacterota bacterium]